MYLKHKRARKGKSRPSHFLLDAKKNIKDKGVKLSFFGVIIFSLLTSFSSTAETEER